MCIYCIFPKQTLSSHYFYSIFLLDKILSPRSWAYALANIDPHLGLSSYLLMTACRSQKKELEHKSFSRGQCTVQLQYFAFFLWVNVRYLQRYNCVPRWTTLTFWKTCWIRQKWKILGWSPFSNFHWTFSLMTLGGCWQTNALLIDMLLLLIMLVEVLSPTPPFRWPYSRGCWQELSFMLDGAFNQASSSSAAFVGKCFMLPCMSLQVGGNIDLRCIVILSWNTKPCFGKWMVKTFKRHCQHYDFLSCFCTIGSILT